MSEPNNGRPARNRLLFERARHYIEGLNVEQQTLGNLCHACEDRRIEVRRLPFRRAHGCSFYEGGQPFIYINSLLSIAEQTIAAHHEFVHIQEHAFEVEVFHSTGDLWNLSKYEYQAQAVGAVAWMPDPLIFGLGIEGIMREFGVSRRLAEFRLSLRG